jgi:DNA-binding ferritin-like protein
MIDGTARPPVAAAEAAKDFVTHDLKTGRLADHEKVVWMLRATLAD